MPFARQRPRRAGAGRTTRTRCASSRAACRAGPRGARRRRRRPRAVGEREEGRIEFSGPSATQRLLPQPGGRRATLFDGDWLDTGDLGYLADGELYITGRVEGHRSSAAGATSIPTSSRRRSATSRACARAASRCSAAPIAAAGTERLVVLAETRASRRRHREALARSDQRHAALDVARRAARRHRARPAAHGAQDLERQDPPRRQPRVVRAGGARAQRRAVLAAGAAPAPAARSSPRAAARAAAVRRQLAYRPHARWLLGCWRRWPGRLPRCCRCRQRLALARCGRASRAAVPALPACRSPCAASSTCPDGPCVLVASTTRAISTASSLLARAAGRVAASSPSASSLDQLAVPRSSCAPLGTVFVERFDVAAQRRTMRAPGRRARSGEALVCLSPRARSPARRACCRSTWAPSSPRRRAGAPVVPVALRGTRSCCATASGCSTAATSASLRQAARTAD